MTLAALGEVFEAARGIMSWLGDCAKVSYVACWRPNNVTYWLLLTLSPIGLCICYITRVCGRIFPSWSLFLKVSQKFCRWLHMKTRLFTGPLLLVFLLYNHTVKLNAIWWVFYICNFFLILVILVLIYLFEIYYTTIHVSFTH